jgi:putative ABC transport system ATP-binding protein
MNSNAATVNTLKAVAERQPKKGCVQCKEENVARKPVIEVRDLVKEFRLGGETLAAINGVSFTVHSGEIVSIVGPSGSGKSTLLGLLGGLDSPTFGSVAIDGLEISSMNEHDLTNIRNEKLGFVFQFFNLIPTLSALENVALPIQFARKRKFKPEERAQELLTHLGLGDRLKHCPQQLSGGEQQRVAIARALANNPPILLADEPTGNLNTQASELVIDTIKKAHQDYGTTVIIVTHSMAVAGQVERVLTLVDGKVV